MTSLGNVLLKKKRFSADGQNIAQNCTTMRVLQSSTALSPQLYNYESCGDNAVLDCNYERLQSSTALSPQLYNYESCGDNAVLDCSQPPEEDLQPILREEVEIAVASLKKGTSAGVDNITAELVQAGGETMINVLTEICNRIWRTGEWPTYPMDSVPDYYTP